MTRWRSLLRKTGSARRSVPEGPRENERRAGGSRQAAARCARSGGRDALPLGRRPVSCLVVIGLEPPAGASRNHRRTRGPPPVDLGGSWRCRPGGTSSDRSRRGARFGAGTAASGAGAGRPEERDEALRDPRGERARAEPARAVVAKQAVDVGSSCMVPSTANEPAFAPAPWPKSRARKERRASSGGPRAHSRRIPCTPSGLRTASGAIPRPGAQEREIIAIEALFDRGAPRRASMGRELPPALSNVRAQRASTRDRTAPRRLDERRAEASPSRRRSRMPSSLGFLRG